jgi:hypothetical protein
MASLPKYDRGSRAFNDEVSNLVEVGLSYHRCIENAMEGMNMPQASRRCALAFHASVDALMERRIRNLYVEPDLTSYAAALIMCANLSLLAAIGAAAISK